MSVTLTWTNNYTATATAINIYRNTPGTTLDNIGSPITSIAGNLSTYTDTTATANTVYDYRVEIVVGTQTTISPRMQMYNGNPGPGPTKPILGDWMSGYFGKVLTANFITPSAFRTLVGMTATVGTVTADATVVGWHKFAFNGKIIFVPDTALNTGVEPYQIYNLGLMFGTNDNGSYIGSLGSGTVVATNQQKIVAIQGFNWLVRCPKLSATIPTNQYMVAATDQVGSEWQGTMARLLLNVGTNLGPLARMSDLASVPTAISQHHTTSTGIPCVGGTTTDVNNTIVTNGGVASARQSGWLPFVEMIPS